MNEQRERVAMKHLKTAGLVLLAGVVFCAVFPLLMARLDGSKRFFSVEFGDAVFDVSVLPVSAHTMEVSSGGVAHWTDDAGEHWLSAPFLHVSEAHEERLLPSPKKNRKPY